MEGRVSNAPLAIGGLASKPIRNMNNNSVINMGLNIPVPAPVNKASAMLATVNIKLAPAILATNTPVPAPAIPVAPAPLAAENTPPAPAPADMSGTAAAANNN